MLSQVINLINQSFKNNAIKNADFGFYGITEMIPTVENDRTVFYPNIVNEFGDCKQINIDNTTSGCVYYRLLNKATTVNKWQYGDLNKEQTDTFTLNMFVIGNRYKLKKTSSDFIQLLSAWFPDVIKANGKQVGILQFTNTDFNSSSIINSEFANTDYSGMPDVFMFRQDFVFKYTYRKKCLDVCEENCINYSSN